MTPSMPCCQLKTLAQGILRTTGIVAPVVFLHLRRRIDLKRHFTLERQRREVDNIVLTDVEPQVDTLVDGKARHQTMLVVDVSP